MDETRCDVTDRLVLGMELPSIESSAKVRLHRSIAEAVNEATEFYGVFSGKAPRLVKIGYDPVDRHAGGVYPRQMAIIAARPGAGKSWFTVNCAMKSARSAPAGYISCEDPAEVVGNRALAIAARVDEEKTRMHSTRSLLSRGDFERIEQGRAVLSTLPLEIATPESSDLGSILITMKSLQEFGAQIIYVDYLQYISGCQRKEGLDAILEAFGDFTKSTDIPIVAVSQMRRPPPPRPSGFRGSDSEDDNDPRLRAPLMDELKGSGALEEKGKLIVALWGKPERLRTKILKTSIGKADIGADFQLTRGYFEPYSGEEYDGS